MRLCGGVLLAVWKGSQGGGILGVLKFVFLTFLAISNPQHGGKGTERIDSLAHQEKYVMEKV